MVWWLFLKKRGINLHVNKIESVLKNSFNNIKSDIHSITSHIHKHGNSIDKIHKKLEQLEHNISYLHTKLEDTNLELDDERDITVSNKGKIIDNLTDVQKSILLRLAHLQAESNENWISTKNLTEDLYPEKEYNKIRPMMSDYLNILLEFGLINKIRKRRQTYVSLSIKALNFVPKNKQKKLIKIINKF